MLSLLAKLTAVLTVVRNADILISVLRTYRRRFFILKQNSMATKKWALDPTHSEIQFKVKHLMISKVTGQFKAFTATVETEGEDVSTSSVDFSADVSSISTNNEQRDAHLRNSDFFDVDNHPKLTFVSTGMQHIEDEKYKMTGILTMRGVSKEEVFDVEFGGTVQDPWGNTRMGVEVSGKINRKDYGVSFSVVSETGSLLLGEDVSLHIQAEFVELVEKAEAVAS